MYGTEGCIYLSVYYWCSFGRFEAVQYFSFDSNYTNRVSNYEKRRVGLEIPVLGPIGKKDHIPLKRKNPWVNWVLKKKKYSWIGSHNNEMYRWTVGHCIECIVAVFRENYFRLGKTCLRTRLFYHYPPGLWLSLLLMRYHWNKYHWSWSLVLQCETLLRSRVVPTTCSKLAKRLSSA